MHLSMRLVEGLTAGTDFIPAFAGTRQRVLAVLLDNDDGKPHELIRTHAPLWDFDTDGSIAAGLSEAASDALSSISFGPGSVGNVVSLAPKLGRKRLTEKHRWTPTKADLDLVIADIWPKTRADRLKQAKGVAPRRPPLTYDAKQALREASEPFWKIEYAVVRLNERSLAGLAFEARRLASEGEFVSLHQAIAEIADARLAILRRRRSNKGIWYAVLEVSRWDATYNCGEVIATYHRRCDGKLAAIKGAQELLAAHAKVLSDTITVEATVETDLEWDAAGRLSKEG